VILAFDALNPYAYKVDLTRICNLYILGAWYMDIALRPMVFLNILDKIEFFRFGIISLSQEGYLPVQKE